MYDIIICIHIWMCLYNCLCMYRYIYVVYIYIYIYICIHKRFTQDSKMECSRDSCHHMRYIDCSSAMILGTSRLLSAPDPPWTGRWIKGVLSLRPWRLRRLFPRHTYVHIFHDFSLIQLRSTLCVVYLCPRIFLKRRREFLRRNVKEEFLSNEEIKRKTKRQKDP